MNKNRRILVLLGLAILSCCLSSMALSPAPLDNRTWDEVVADLTSTNDINSLTMDSKRLLNLDRQRALETFLPLLSEDNPTIVRLRAIDGIGRGRFREAIPAIEKIICDTEGDMRTRRYALNIGLRYMNNSNAVDIAERYVDHNDEGMRKSAHWVLSDHGGDREIDILAKCLNTDIDLRANIIIALSYTRNEKAANLVFKTVDVEEVHTNENVAINYSSIMCKYRFSGASEVMLSLFSHESSSVREQAFRYFIRLPNLAAIPMMIKYLEERKRPFYYNSQRERLEIYKVFELKGLTDKQKMRLRELYDKKLELSGYSH